MSASVLGQIVARTRERLHDRRRQRPLDEMLAQAPTPGTRRPFASALSQEGWNLIAEFKRRSPSKGVLREDLPAAGVAQAYEAAGARALSVLTEEDFFGGHLGHLRQARAGRRQLKQRGIAPDHGRMRDRRHRADPARSGAARAAKCARVAGAWAPGRCAKAGGSPASSASSWSTILPRAGT